jgi:hypothetical protein
MKKYTSEITLYQIKTYGRRKRKGGKEEKKG